MEDDVFARLADALDRLPNAYPRTKSGVELAILKKIFTPEQASVAYHLSGEMEPADVIAERAGIPAGEAENSLAEMAGRGMLWTEEPDGKMHYRLAPFVVGIYEAQLHNMDHELAHLFDEYLAEGGAAGLMKPQPSLHRVVPARGAVKSEWVLPYDDVRELLELGKNYRVNDCICKLQQKLVGRGCDAPMESCLSFSSVERPPRPGDISREDAFAVLDMAEEVGLVHTVSNVIEGVWYVCNCCGCCCGILRGITEFGIEESVAHANYHVEIDDDYCTGCLTCIDRCQVNAVKVKEGITVVEMERCIGCGLCVTGCPSKAMELKLKPADEIVPPPVDYGTWERERLKNRGLGE